MKIPRGLSAITGEGTTQIEITGRRSITFSGRSDYTVGQVQTVANRQSKFPTITFDQTSQFTVRGQIGDRITIDLSQDSNNPEDLASTLRLSYKGPEDGIVQEIEAGNTQLSLPGTRLVGFSQGRGGLFGIRGKATVGGLDIQMIASQDKGSANRKTFRGESQESSNNLRDYQYIQNTYFFLDETYRQAWSRQQQAEEQVRDETVEVYVNDFTTYNDISLKAISARAIAFNQKEVSKGFPDPSPAWDLSGVREVGMFHKLDRSEFQAYTNGYIILNQPLSDYFALAVAYRTQGKSYGDLNFFPRDSTDTARLKLIKAKNQRPGSPTWDLMWKNVYSLGGRNVERAGFAIRVLRDVAGQEPLDHQDGKSYLQILGLDRHGQTGSSPPDNLVDLDQNIVDLLRGELIFPYLEPFGAQGVGAPDLKNPAPEIYNEANATTQRERSQYSIEIKSQSRQTQFNLGYGDVIDNSEQVRLNGRLLRRGQDYTVDYITGALSFQPGIATEVANPSANLDISWDSKSLFGFAAQQKSLLGLRAEHKLAGGDGQSLLGMTFLYSNQRTPSRRVRVGSEPSRSMVLDANARLEFKPQFLTDLVNALPFVRAHTPSALRVNAEAATSLPNPNTLGAAYIDDFEGSSSTIPLSIFRAAWTYASDPTEGGARTSLQSGKLVWYNPYERVRVTDIQPYRAESITAEQNIDDILVLKFSPRRDKYGADRKVPRGFDPLWREGRPLASWAWIMTAIRGGMDLSRSKFLEIWVRGDRGKLHVDLGEISEDLTLPFDDGPNGQLSTEDKALAGTRVGDNILQTDEETGLDFDPVKKKNMTDKEEQERFKALFPTLSPVPEDPSGDNWAYESRSSNYERINGLEGNGLKDGDRAGIPDTEDINNNSVLDTRNDYWRYSVDLSRDNLDGLRAEGTDYNGWRLVRIPLRDDKFRKKEGNPDANLSTAIDFARVWVEHSDSTTVELYQIYATVTDWQEDQKERLKVTARNSARDAFYEPPPGLEQEIDPTNPSLRLPEGSLALQFGDLHPNEGISTTRIFPSGETYTDYARMRMSVHGGNRDPGNRANGITFPAPSDTARLDDRVGGINPPELFLRFGPGSRDTSNFYEYRTRVYQGWDALNEVDISMALMSQLKGFLQDLSARASRDTPRASAADSLDAPPGVNPDYEYRRALNEVKATIGSGAERKTYIVRGNPAFSGIRTFTIGIRNAGGDVISGGNGQNELWVDELRVDNIRKKRAFSGVLDLEMQLSDFGRMSVNLAYQGGDFQDLRSRAPGIARNSISLNNTFNLERFFPASWGLNIPFSFSMNRNAQAPRIRRGSDIVLTTEQRRDESDLQSSTQASVSFRKQPAQQNPRLLSTLIFDRITARLSVNTQTGQTGAITQRNHSDGRSVSGSFDYNMAPTKDRAVRPLAWMPLKSLKQVEFHYLPNILRYAATLNQNISNSGSFSAVGRDTTNRIAANAETFDMTEDYSAKITPLRSLSAGYSLNIRRDLQRAFRPAQLQFGKEVGRTQSADVSLTMGQISWLSQSYSYNASYSESNDPRGQGYSPVGQGRRGRDVNVSSQVGGRYNLGLPNLFKKLGGRRSYTATEQGGEKKEDKGGGFPVLGWIGQMGSNLRNVTVQASRNKTASRYGLADRPGLLYQLGLQDTTDAPRTELRGITRIDAFSTADRLSGDGGVNLPLGMSVNSRYEYSRERRTGNSANSPAIHSANTSFPVLNLSWGNFGQLPVVRWMFSSASAEASYDRREALRGEGGTGPFHVLDHTEETNVKPFGLNFQWKSKVNMNIQQAIRRSLGVSFQPNEGDSARAELSRTLSEGSTLSASLRYSFSPTSGLFKRFNLKSNVDMTLEFAQQSNVQRQTAAGSQEYTKPQDDGSWSVGLSSSYRFNQNFTGQMRIRHENRRDKVRNQTHKVWEFSLTGDIVFN
ncbi:MAG: cell surface protein SprA [Candidatus Handelsmanbacteria bacterium RIFCSPLOWO2_12_FULL_64_10]|uniref:Cell surface protein SprA n=1 Tax=Handelsmanbacteria sp. (strain RIFCSPLOWO2_12_FULL_64_10) TaxID=1817868 RepID=A0A1F6CXT0_HANXR|nr:MAG: cell surface protein SprA [Candidatus Handelsmanbacteria bacterium RIFCSPLOWO2_12_FULL_64_10]